MIIIFGNYKIASKITAYRSDWCNHCEKAVVANQVRRFYLGHIFWIPLIPLGFHKTWICKECGENPRDRTQTSIGLLVIAAITFGIMGVFTLFAPYVGRDAGIGWIMRFIFIGATIGLIYWIKYRIRDIPMTKDVPALNNDKCLMCSGPMKDIPNHHCLDCGVIREGA
jgi:hypothetical protein